MGKSFLLINCVIFILNFLGEITILLRCADSGKKRAGVFLVRAAKLFGINMFFDIFWPAFYPGTYPAGAKLWVNLATMFISMLLLKLIFQFSWGKLGMVYMIANARAFICTLVPLLLVSAAKGMTMSELMRQFSKSNYIGCVSFSIILLFLTEKMLAKQCERIRVYSLKKEWIWATVFFTYLIA